MEALFFFATFFFGDNCAEESAFCSAVSELFRSAFLAFATSSFPADFVAFFLCGLVFPSLGVELRSVASLSVTSFFFALLCDKGLVACLTVRFSFAASSFIRLSFLFPSMNTKTAMPTSFDSLRSYYLLLAKKESDSKGSMCQDSQDITCDVQTSREAQENAQTEPKEKGTSNLYPISP